MPVSKKNARHDTKADASCPHRLSLIHARKPKIFSIRTLMLRTRQDGGACLTPRKLAECVGNSPTDLFNVTPHIVNHRIREAAHGVNGGVRSVLRSKLLTLPAVDEARLGTIAGADCRSFRPSLQQCSFHRAAMKLGSAITGVLERRRIQRAGCHILRPWLRPATPQRRPYGRLRCARTAA